MKLTGRAGTISLKIEIASIERSGDDLVIRGKIMDMPSLIYLTPQEFWMGRRLVTFRLVRYLPVFIWRGWRRRSACS